MNSENNKVSHPHELLLNVAKKYVYKELENVLHYRAYYTRKNKKVI